MPGVPAALGRDFGYTPREELRDFIADDEAKPKTMLDPRDPSLDPQLVWKGKCSRSSNYRTDVARLGFAECLEVGQILRPAGSALVLDEFGSADKVDRLVSEPAGLTPA